MRMWLRWMALVVGGDWRLLPDEAKVRVVLQPCSLGSGMLEKDSNFYIL
jgi:hypothetical protein